MKKVNMKHWGKILLLGSALLVVGAGSALAAPDSAVSTSLHLASAAEDRLTNKQAEIDEYVAGAGQEELSAQGFTVTHTGVVGDKVEVGITPYNEQYAEFLYEKFGRDIVQVVEGEQAILYGANAAEADVVAAEEAGTNPWIWVGAAVVIIAGGLLIAGKKRFRRS